MLFPYRIAVQCPEHQANVNHHIAATATIIAPPKTAAPHPPACDTAPPVAGTTVHVELATKPAVVAGIVAILIVELLAGVAAAAVAANGIVAVPLVQGPAVTEVDKVEDMSMSVQLQSSTVTVVAL